MASHGMAISTASSTKFFHALSLFIATPSDSGLNAVRNSAKYSNLATQRLAAAGPRWIKAASHAIQNSDAWRSTLSIFSHVVGRWSNRWSSSEPGGFWIVMAPSCVQADLLGKQLALPSPVANTWRYMAAFEPSAFLASNSSWFQLPQKIIYLK